MEVVTPNRSRDKKIFKKLNIEVATSRRGRDVNTELEDVATSFSGRDISYKERRSRHHSMVATSAARYHGRDIIRWSRHHSVVATSVAMKEGRDVLQWSRH